MMEPRIQYATTEGGLQGGQGLASKVVRNVSERWETGDETLIDESCSAPCVWRGPGGEQIRGQESMKQLMGALGVAFTSVRPLDRHRKPVHSR